MGHLDAVLQSQQARLATLYLPLFGLLQENVHRLNVKEVSPFTVNHSNNVRLPSSGQKEKCLKYTLSSLVLMVTCFSPLRLLILRMDGMTLFRQM